MSDKHLIGATCEAGFVIVWTPDALELFQSFDKALQAIRRTRSGPKRPPRKRTVTDGQRIATDMNRKLQG